MNKNNMLKKATSIVVIASMLNSSLVFATEVVQKNETVYITLTQQGKTKETIVSDWLHSDEKGLKIEDKTSLKDIINVKGDEVPTKQGNKVVWELNGNDLFYQGKTDKKAPLNVNIKYYLDGKEIKAEDLAGKSGKLKIVISFKNTEKHTVNIKGKDFDLFTPLSVLTTMDLPMDTFNNVKIGDGKIVSDGNNQIVTLLSFPGLEESLDLDSYDIDELNDLDFPETFEITADVTDFEMGPIMITATTELPKMDELKKAEEVDDLRDALDDLQDASTKLCDGSQELSDGVDEAKEKLDESKADLETMDPAKRIRSLVTDADNVNSERILINDAFDFYDMDKNLIDLAPDYVTHKNIRLYDKIKKDTDDLDLDYILDDPFIKSLPDKLNDENVAKARKLVDDADELKKLDLGKIMPYLSLLNSSKDLLKIADEGMGMMDSISKEDMNMINNLMQPSNIKKFERVTDAMPMIKGMSNKLVGLMANMTPMLETELSTQKEKLNQAIQVAPVMPNVTTSAAWKLLDAKQNSMNDLINYGKIDGAEDDFIKVKDGLEVKLNNVEQLKPAVQILTTTPAVVNLPPEQEMKAKIGLKQLIDSTNIPSEQKSGLKMLIDSNKAYLQADAINQIVDGTESTLNNYIELLDYVIENKIVPEDKKGALSAIITSAIQQQKYAANNIDVAKGIIALGIQEIEEFEDVMSNFKTAVMNPQGMQNFSFNSAQRRMIINSIISKKSIMKAAIVDAPTNPYVNLFNNLIDDYLCDENTLDATLQMFSIAGDIDYASKLLTPKTIDTIKRMNNVFNRAKGLEKEVNDNKSKIKEAKDLMKDKETMEYMNTWIPKLLSMKKDVDANEENIETVKELLKRYDDPKYRKVKDRIHVLEDDLDAVRPILKSLKERLSEPNMNKALHESPEMMNQLLDMKKDLETHRKIIEILNEVVQEDNVRIANKLLDSLPDLEDGIKELKDGANELADKMKEFDEDGIQELKSKLTEKLDSTDELIDKKDALVKLSDEYGLFAGKSDNMEGKLKFVMKTEEIEKPVVKTVEKKEDQDEDKGMINWLKGILGNIFKK